MKLANRRTLAVAAALLFSALVLSPAQAAESKSPAADATHRGAGIVKEIKTTENKIKIDHGPIQSLGWGGMTMFFNVSEPRLLENLKPGDKVTFDIGRDRNGRFVITGMTRVKLGKP